MEQLDLFGELKVQIKEGEKTRVCTKCNIAADIRSRYLDATRPESMWEADYWVWCTQMPQEV